MINSENLKNLYESNFEGFLISLKNENNKEKLKNLFLELYNHLMKSDSIYDDNFLVSIFPVLRRIVDNDKNKIVNEFDIDKYIQKFSNNYNNFNELIKLNKTDLGDLGIDNEAIFCEEFADFWVENYLDS
jgi:hypothetical protein